MADPDDVCRIALGLDGVVEEWDGRFRVAGKLLCWPGLGRVDAGRSRVPNRDVLVVRVASVGEKHALIALDGSVVFTEPHDDGYAAVVVRLGEIDSALLEASSPTPDRRRRGPGDVARRAVRRP